MDYRAAGIATGIIGGFIGAVVGFCLLPLEISFGIVLVLGVSAGLVIFTVMWCGFYQRFKRK